MQATNMNMHPTMTKFECLVIFVGSHILRSRGNRQLIPISLPRKHTANLPIHAVEIVLLPMIQPNRQCTTM